MTRADLEKSFITTTEWDGLLKRFNELEASLALASIKLDKRFYKFKAEEAQAVDKTCQDLMSSKFDKYEKVTNDFSKFFSEGEISNLIENKADVRMLEEITSVKASKEELASTEGMIQNLNERVKHLSGLLATLAYNIIPIKTTLGNFDNPTKKQILLQMNNIKEHSRIVNSWIHEASLQQDNSKLGAKLDNQNVGLHSI